MERPAVESSPSSPEGRQTSFQQWFRRYAPYLFALSAALPAARSEANPSSNTAPDSQGISAIAERLPMEHREGTEQTDRDIQWPGAHWTFFSKDSTGASHFEPGAILAPVQLEFSQNEQIASQMDFQLPYEYSRLFDTGAPLRPEDHDKLVSFIDQELKREFVDRLYGLDLNKRVYETKHGAGSASLDSLKITDIQITGTASPEGPNDMGSESLEPGYVEEENLELADIRAEAGEVLTIEGLKKFGVTSEQLNLAEANIHAEELQFTDGELRDLVAAADSLGYEGADDLECIYNLVVDYNDGKVTDSDAIAVLDQAVASKRSVQVAVSYEGKRERVLMVPLPLLLFALIPLRRLRRAPADPIPGKTPDQSTPPELERIPDHVRKIPLPDKETPEYTEMEERVVIDDLWQHYDRTVTVERGLDYHRITAEFDTQLHERLQTDEDRELVLTMQVLEAWKRHDRRCRELAGVSEDQLNLGLDYENQPRQILWARMHARELLGLMNDRRATGNSEQEGYRGVLGARTDRLIQRRILKRLHPDSN